jgi:hypothetical protein
MRFAELAQAAAGDEGPGALDARPLPRTSPGVSASAPEAPPSSPLAFRSPEPARLSLRDDALTSARVAALDDALSRAALRLALSMDTSREERL